MKRERQVAVVCTVGLLAWAPAALAAGQRPPQPTDPKATSPAGTIYAIPLDSARSDAAPHRRSGVGAAGGSSGSNGGGSASSGGTGQGGGSGSASSGSSSTGSGSGGSSGGASSSAASTSGASKDPGSLIHSENGFGSSSQVPGLGAGAASAATVALSTGGGGAPTGAIALLGVVLLVGGYAGVFASRRTKF
ncbi:MAG: hypothetical protein JWN32_1173 [Solirubrobacterales bacterium]|nr:hypothetical protein [Solirubrobacterales bacterium]